MNASDLKRRRDEVLAQNAERLEAHREGRQEVAVVVSGEEQGFFWSRVVLQPAQRPEGHLVRGTESGEAVTR